MKIMCVHVIPVRSEKKKDERNLLLQRTGVSG